MGFLLCFCCTTSFQGGCGRLILGGFFSLFFLFFGNGDWKGKGKGGKEKGKGTVERNGDALRQDKSIRADEDRDLP